MQVAVDKLGRIQYCNENLYMDNGFLVDEPVYNIVLENYFNCYTRTRWNFKVFSVTTDTASNTWCRAPGKKGKKERRKKEGERKKEREEGRYIWLRLACFYDE